MKNSKKVFLFAAIATIVLSLASCEFQEMVTVAEYKKTIDITEGNLYTLSIYCPESGWLDLEFVAETNFSVFLIPESEYWKLPFYITTLPDETLRQASKVYRLKENNWDFLTTKVDAGSYYLAIKNNNYGSTKMTITGTLSKAIEN